MKKASKWIKCLLLLTIMLVLSGCSLAREDAEVGKEKQEEAKARLVGVFLTEKSINLVDYEDLIMDNIDKIAEGEEIDLESTSEENRIYGVIDKHKSEDVSEWEIQFGDLKGISFFYSKWGEGEEAFSMIMGGEEVCDVSQHLSVTDEGESIKITGTINMLAKDNEEQLGYFVNPVYMTEDGKYFVVPGTGQYTNSAASMSAQIEDKTEWIKDKTKKEFGGAVSILFDVYTSEPKTIRLHYMDQKLGCLKKEEFNPGAVSESVSPIAGTACIIVETEWQDGSFTREIKEKDDGDFQTFVKLNEKLLVKKYTTINWE